jgi:short-subunit dehydrogenase
MSRTAQLRAPEALRARYGPWAVVTGASSGIGREMAVALAGAGVHLVLVARRRAELEELSALLKTHEGVQTRVVVADLSTDAGIARLQDGTEDLDVGLLVASAGFGTSGAFLTADPVQELAMLDVNCRASLQLCLHFGPRLAERGRGGLVLMSSLVGFQGTPGAAHYAATKAYVQVLAEGLHAELKLFGVDVVASAPGPVHSGFAERADMRMGRAMAAADVVPPTLNALGRRTTVAPGVLTKVLTWSLAPLPRRFRVRIMTTVMGGMTRHQGTRASALDRLRTSHS